MSLDFTKMHGAGNDYVYVEGFSKELPADLAALAVRLSDRHTGVGGDGLIAVLPPTDAGAADVRMRMFNNDGSEAEMCGNGIRCVAKLAHDRGLVDTAKNPLKIETGRGVLSVDLDLAGDGTVSAVTVDMGEPILKLDAAGVKQSATTRNAGFKKRGEHVYEVATRRQPGPIDMTFVSMGNPHAVVFVDDVSAIDPAALGPELETLPIFPRRMNVHWVQVISAGEVRVVHWERGTGVTQACGTGACAVCVAGALTGRTGREIVAHLPGGDLRLRWDEASNHVFMTGPAVEVFRGSVSE